MSQINKEFRLVNKNNNEILLNRQGVLVYEKTAFKHYPKDSDIWTLEPVN